MVFFFLLSTSVVRVRVRLFVCVFVCLRVCACARVRVRVACVCAYAYVSVLFVGAIVLLSMLIKLTFRSFYYSHVTGMHSLLFLDVSCASRISTDGLQMMCANAHNLQVLHMERCVGLKGRLTIKSNVSA